MIELVDDLVQQQFITAGSVYAVMEERIRAALRIAHWNTAEELQRKMQSAFPFYLVEATMNEVYIARLGLKPESARYKFYL